MFRFKKYSSSLNNFKMKNSISVFLTACSFLVLLSSTAAQISKQKQMTSSTTPSFNNRDVVLNTELLPEGFTTIKTKLPFSTEEKEYVVKMQPIEGTQYFNYILDGDIIVGNNMPGTRIYAADNSKFLWQGDIPVFLHKSVGDSNMCSVVNNAIALIERNTKIHFIKHSTQSDYIQIRIGDPGGFTGGVSPLGRQGGMQEVIVSRYVDPGLIAHELLHSLGIYHEQSRKDRDNYVKIIKKNIIDKYAYNFNIVPGTSFTNYDYASIMHYNASAFSKNELQTIICLSNGSDLPCPSKMGQRDALSTDDAIGLNSFYNNVSFSPSRITTTLDQSSALYLRILFDSRNVSLPLNTSINEVIGFRVMYPNAKKVRNDICSGTAEFVGYTDFAAVEPTVEFTTPASYSGSTNVIYATIKNMPVEKKSIGYIEPYLKTDCLQGSDNQQTPAGRKQPGFRTWVENDQTYSDTYHLKGFWFDYGIIPPNSIKKGWDWKDIKSDGPMDKPGIEMKKDIKQIRNIPVQINKNIPVKQQ
jgi:Astacin (Peptidase family M12A)